MTIQDSQNPEKGSIEFAVSASAMVPLYLHEQVNLVHSRVKSDYLGPLRLAKLRLELDEPESPSLPFPSDGYTSGSNHM